MDLFPSSAIELLFSKVGPKYIPKVCIKTEEELKYTDLEEIIFRPVGDYPYRLKKVEIVGPDQNVAGLTWIKGNYYKKELLEL